MERYTAAANVGNWVYGGNDCSDNSSSTQNFKLSISFRGYMEVSSLCDSASSSYDVTLKVNGNFMLDGSTNGKQAHHLRVVVHQCWCEWYVCWCTCWIS